MTAKFLKVETTLGQPLAAWVDGHRDQGMSWAWIAIELSRLTGGAHITPGELEEWHAGTTHSVTYRADPFRLCQ